MTTTTAHPTPPIPKIPPFPPHNAPRVWFLTNGISPIAISLARHVLMHGDYVVAGVLPSEFEKEETGRSKEFREFLEEVKWQGEEEGNGRDDTAGGEGRNGASDIADGEKGKGKAEGRKMKRWRERVRVVELDGRIMGQCQAAVAEAVEAFGRIDIMLGCTSEAVVGAIEELAQSPRTLTVVRDQFETNFFANVNIIKAVLPAMRARKNGHIIILTGITGHLGTPGLGIYCASQWAIEGYCDSLAYEIAPFNIKMTIVQPNMEINVLTNRITSVPPLPFYSPDVNPAPLARELLSGLLDQLDATQHTTTTPRFRRNTTSNTNPDARTPTNTRSSPPSPSDDLDPDADAVPSMGDQLSAPHVSSLYPPLGPQVKAALIAETVFAIAAIGGHDNPPARHIVGFEGVASVKEKLKTVSEELEDFVEVSAAVDFARAEEGSVGGMGGG